MTWVLQQITCREEKSLEGRTVGLKRFKRHIKVFQNGQNSTTVFRDATLAVTSAPP